MKSLLMSRAGLTDPELLVHRIRLRSSQVPLSQCRTWSGRRGRISSRHHLKWALFTTFFTVLLLNGLGVKYSYLVEEVNAAYHSNLCGVVKKPDVSFCGSVELPDVNIPEAIQKFVPYVCSYTVTYSNLHFVVSVIVSLWEIAQIDIIFKTSNIR